MKPAHIFEVCHDRVVEYRATFERITAIRADACSKDGPPRVGNVRAEYVADFDKCGQRSLRKWPARYQMFRLYYVEGHDSCDVMVALKLKEGTFWWWARQIQQFVGVELKKAKLYPPGRYTT